MHTSKVCRVRIRSIQRQQPARSILQYIVDRKHSGISSMRRCQSMICMILIYMHSSGASKMQKWEAVMGAYNRVNGEPACGSKGLQNGLEKISKILMSALLIMIVVLAVHSFTPVRCRRGNPFLPDSES